MLTAFADVEDQLSATAALILQQDLRKLASEAADQERDNSLTLLTIQQAVAKEWGVTVEGLRSKTRTKLLTTPRQIAMYLTRELLATQLVEIGNGFGGRDHSTVIHSLEKVQEAVSRDSELKNRIQRIRTALQNLAPVHT